MRFTIAPVTRLIVLCERPRHLTRDQAIEWFREATACLRVGGGPVKAVRLTELESPSIRWGRSWDWLLEVELASVEAAGELMSDGPGGDLLADLRLLGMHPAVAVASPTRTTDLGADS